MDRNAKAIADQLLRLPSRDRARIAELLLSSLEEDGDTGSERTWNNEIARRESEFEQGEVEGVPADAVFAEVERRLKR